MSILFDIVGMLNREHTITKLPGDSDEPLRKPVDTVNVLVPFIIPRLLIQKVPYDFGVFNRMGEGIY